MAFRSDLVESHSVYLRDRRRLEGYARAIERAVRPGDRVLDLGTGTGVLGLLALRAGAGRLYAVDEGRLLEVARAVFRANGFDERVVAIRAHSRRLVLPEPVDVVVADQMGGFGVDAGIVEDLADVRARFLRPGGTLVPGRLDLFLAPVECPRGWERIAVFETPVAGFDLRPARDSAVHAPQSHRFARDDLLAEPTAAASLELGAARESVAIDATFVASRGGTMHGLAGWFATSSGGEPLVGNAPGDPSAIDRDQVFFPLGEPVLVSPGTSIRVGVRVFLPDVVAWTVELAGRRFAQTNVRALPLGSVDLARMDPASRPRLSATGEARRAVLALCDARHEIGEIEARLLAEHGSLFRTRAEAAAFVAATLERDGS